MHFQSNTRYLADRVVEAVGLHMTLPWPGHQMSTARGVRHFPLHDRLLAAGAVMGERVGWEFPLYFDPCGGDRTGRLEHSPSLGYQAWFPFVERECLTARDAAVLVDQSCYGKLLVSGPDAAAALNRICANQVDVPAGRSVYTQWLNERGGIEADVTVTRFGDEEFLVITGHPSQVRDRGWFQAHLEPAWHVQCHDVTANYGMFSLSGPRARDILAALTDADVSNDALPFGAARFIDLGYGRAWVLRRSFLGEFGFEIYPTTDLCRHIYEELLKAGAAHGLMNAGFLAMNHCRVEKGFAHFGHDIGEEDSPFDAGLGFAVAMDKPGGFIGMEALRRQRQKGPPQTRLVNLRLREATLQAGPYLLRGEPLWRGDEIVGYVTSGAWGFRLGGSFGMGFVRNIAGIDTAWLQEGGFDVDVAGIRHPVQLQTSGYYDPRGLRQRG
jgi:4-methylaminobutanoate oxidase (formaldehyde-forming)